MLDYKFSVSLYIYAILILLAKQECDLHQHSTQVITFYQILKKEIKMSI